MTEHTLILATRNSGKAQQIRALFEGSPFQILSLDEAGIEGEAVEDGATLEENAEKKARYAYERSGALCMADDTGLFIDALGGEPGIRAARWAGEHATAEDIMRFTLDQLRNVPSHERTATFRTVASLILTSGECLYFTGEVRGVIAEEPLCALQPKLPYSAIFVPLGLEKPLAALSPEELSHVSHRAQAFTALRRYIEKTA